MIDSKKRRKVYKSRENYSGTVFGEFIRQKRQEKGMTLEEVAERLAKATGTKADHSLVGRYETGARGVPIHKAVKLGEIMGIPDSETTRVWSQSRLGVNHPSDCERVQGASEGSFAALTTENKPTLFATAHATAIANKSNELDPIQQFAMMPSSLQEAAVRIAENLDPERPQTDFVIAILSAAHLLRNN
jgi:transcriptional regulator with XRE-family HTH domain